MCFFLYSSHTQMHTGPNVPVTVEGPTFPEGDLLSWQGLSQAAIVFQVLKLRKKSDNITEVEKADGC